MQQNTKKYTTKSLPRANGMWAAMVYKIIKMHLCDWASLLGFCYHHEQNQKISPIVARVVEGHTEGTEQWRPNSADSGPPVGAWARPTKISSHQAKSSLQQPTLRHDS